MEHTRTSLWVVILLALTSCALAEVSSTEVSILRYQALKYTEIENLEHLFYTFEFCACNDHFTGQLPNRSPDCECTVPQRGKRVLESTPQALFPSSCVHTPIQNKCLNVQFTSEQPPKRIYAKVMIGKNIFTFPTWQALAQQKYRTTSTLRSAAGSDMRITYVISNKKEQTLSAMATTPARPPWMNTQPTSSAEPVLDDSSTRSELFDILRAQFAKHKNELSKQKDKSQTTTRPFTTTTEWTTTRRSYTTTHRPATTHRVVTSTALRPIPSRQPSPWKTETKHGDISDVSYIHNVNDVRLYLLKESLKDHQNPLTFDVEAFKDEVLFYHNVYRAKHNAPAVQYDSQLERDAQRWANNLANKKSCLVHEAPRRYGENLFYFGARNMPKPSTMAKAVTQGFYMEGFGYNYGQWFPLSYYKTGHFTQLVWADSKKIGVGIAIKFHDASTRGPCQPSQPSYMVYVCVKYDPAGNFNTYDEYTRNVRAPIR